MSVSPETQKDVGEDDQLDKMFNNPEIGDNLKSKLLNKEAGAQGPIFIVANFSDHDVGTNHTVIVLHTRRPHLSINYCSSNAK